MRNKLSHIWLFLVLLPLLSGCGGSGDSSSEPLSEEQISVKNATGFLSRLMDRYHNRIAVYDDVSSAGNHFVTFAKIPDQNAPVSINGSWTDQPHSGATAIRCDFNGPGFGGIYFLNGILPNGASSPQLNFGTVADSGFDLSGVVRLSFWARGQAGGEQIEFFLAGVGRDATTGNPTQPYPGSSPRYPTQGTTFTLSTSWQQFNIELSSLDLSYVLGGFAWVADANLNPQGATFYLDDIEFELSSSARLNRLNQPRFITSFEMRPIQPDPFDGNADDDIDLVLRNLAFSYDNALALLAFLAEGSDDSLRRARLLGDAYVYAAQHDRFHNNGVIRTAYQAGDISLPPGWTPNDRTGTVPIPGFYSEAQQLFFEVEQEAVDVGNNAWSMIALLGLYKRTLDNKYLTAARDIGNFIISMRNDTGTYQGFQGGIDDPESQTPTQRIFASAEHNIDVLVAFKLMFEITGENSWSPHALHAQNFVEAVFDNTSMCFLAGTPDPETRNTSTGQLPVDVQAWAILARIPLALNNTQAVFDCAETYHRTNLDGFNGFDFNEDKDAVWFEGTGHMATAYGMAGINDSATTLLSELRRAQTTAPFGDGFGISAASRDGLTSGFSFNYYQRLHIAAVAWYVFAQQRFNPYYQESF